MHSLQCLAVRKQFRQLLLLCPFQLGRFALKQLLRRFEEIAFELGLVSQMIQFITPVMQFLIGVAVLHEPMPPERWAGFIIVWIAIGVFVVDLLLAARRGRRTAQPELV